MLRYSLCWCLIVFAALFVSAPIPADELTVDPSVSWNPNVVQSPKQYLVRTTGEGEQSIDEIIVPGRPPRYFRAPLAAVPESNPAAGVTVLSNVPAFAWSYGCAPTAAAMMMGFYDNEAYPDIYAGPTNGGVCPMTNSVWGTGECPLSATHNGIDGRTTNGHVDDYWRAYNNCDPDPSIGAWPEHAQGECTADYMGTSQSLFSNCDGSTTFNFCTDGGPLYDYTGQEPYRRDGCVGLRLFVESRGYPVTTNFSQYIYGYNGNTKGFTFQNLQAEIDAGRPVLIHVAGHTMVGYGYDANGSIIYIHDTWDQSDHQMPWGGSYNGLQHYGVTVLQVSQRTVIRVKPTGNDSNDGSTWQKAKKTVQAAVYYASPGSEIWLVAGTYPLHTDLKGGVSLYRGFAGNEVAREERNWGTNVTILDAQGEGSVVTVLTGATAATRIDGFTIQNGDNGTGGGILCNDYSSPTIANNTIIANRAWQNGGGIYCANGWPTIVNNVIMRNSANDNGGGILCYNSSASILNNVIRENNTTHGDFPGGGGGIACGGSSSPTIANNILLGNCTETVGGGIFSENSSPLIANNTIVGNSAADKGAGIYCKLSSARIANNIVASNFSGIYADSSTNTLTSNCVYGNTVYDYRGLSAGVGDISADPRLASLTYGDAHIQPDSPCRDAGDPSVLYAQALDIDSQARTQSGLVDIGADESDGTTWAVTPAIVRVSTSGADSNDGSSWPLAKRTIQAGIDAAATRGGEVWVKAGTYNQHVTLRLCTYVYGGFSGSELQRPDRNWATNATAIDGQGDLSGAVVAACQAGHLLSAIDGFTICNGLEGGVSCESCSPVIANNKIEQNQALYGGGVWCNHSRPVIIDNTITGNSAGQCGGAIDLHCSWPLIANNTITANGAGVKGGAIVSLGLYLPPPLIVNNIVAFNSSGICNDDLTSVPTLRHNCVYGNTLYDYSRVSPGESDVNEDPKLASTECGNLHIQPDSPCVNAGDDSVVQPGALDVDLQVRIQGAHVDIGADESEGTVWTVTPTMIRVSTTGDDANDGSAWGLAKRTVQAAIDTAAAQRGEVWVKAGTYNENISLRRYVYVFGGFGGGETNRSQRNSLANVTILDGQQNGCVVSALHSGYLLSTIDGFTIRDGNGVVGGGTTTRWGGGIYCVYCSPAITNNAIAGNTVDGGGAGIYCHSACPIISDNMITGNSSEGRGGGIYCEDSAANIVCNEITGNSAWQMGGGISCLNCSPRIRRNLISGNAVYRESVQGMGGGIYCNSSSPAISNNVITANSAASSGGGVHCYNSTAVVSDNIIAWNSAAGYGGGGISCNSSSLVIKNNTIVGNGASPNEGGPDYCGGGGIYCDSAATITNNIIAFGSSGIQVYSYAGSPVLRANCVYGNLDSNYSGISPGAGDVSADPKLASPAYGNLHIQPDSPCVNAGDDSVVQPGALDVDLQVRIQGAHVDIGADESEGTVWTVTPTMIRVSTTGDDANDGSAWGLAKRTVQAAIDTAAAQGGGEVWVRAGTYNERLTLPIYVYVYGGFNGTETTRSERDWRANLTILDGQQGGSVVTAAGGGYMLSAVDGFTIRNGRANYGGGIYCYCTSPMIANNLITDNSSPAHGGGVYLAGSAPMILGNTIARNTPDAIVADHSAPTISGNLLAGNSASGICGHDSSPTVTNNTIAGNSGYGICLYYPIHMPVSNNIITFNTSGIYRPSGAYGPTLRNNDVWGNTSYNYSGISPGVGDISQDPLLANRTGGNYRPLGGSPCINAGWNDSPGLPATDLDGLARIWAGTVDIGAYEFRASPNVSISPPSSLLTQAGPITYTITYGGADAVTLANANVTLNKTGTANGTVAVSGTGNTTRTVTISSITGAGTLGISIAAGTASDLAGNSAPAAGPSTTFNVDNTPPTVSISPPSAAATNTGPVTYTITYGGADAVTLQDSDVTLNKTGTANGTVAVSGTGKTSRAVTISSTIGDGTLGISIAAGTASNLAGTAPAAGPSATFNVDNIAPTISIGAPSASLTSTGPVTYTITYGGADSVTLANAKVTLNKTGTANGTVAVSGTGNMIRTVTISSITGTGTLGISIAAGTASDNADNTAPAAEPSATLTVENSPPVMTSVTDETYTASTTTLLGTWSGCDPESGIQRYEYAVGTDTGSGIANALGWTDAGTTASATIGGPSLSVGQTYYISVRATDGVGLVSAPMSSPGVKIAYSVASVREAKELQNGKPIGLPATLVVSSKFPTKFYLEDGNRVSGIRVEYASSLTAGLTARVFGVLGVTVDGERAILSPKVIPGSMGTAIRPLIVIGQAVGGGDLVMSGVTTPGVTNAMGLNNIGLLVRIAGKVTKGVSNGFYLDDGVGPTDETGWCGVKIWTGASGVSYENTKVVVTGVVSMRRPGATVPLILARDIATE